MAGSDPDIREAIKKALLDGGVEGVSTEDLRRLCGLDCSNKAFSRALGSLVHNTREVMSRKEDSRNTEVKTRIFLTPKGRRSMSQG